MIRTNCNCDDVDIFVDKAKAVLEHLYDNHKYCDASWCMALKAKNEKKKYTPKVHWYSLKNEVEKKNYEQLSKITTKYGNEFYLRQSMHPFDTQTNEALNNSQAMVTPKAKVFHETRAFHYRHAIVVGTHNWGHKKFWTSVFDEAGIKYSTAFVSYLESVDKKKKILPVLELLFN